MAADSTTHLPALPPRASATLTLDMPCPCCGGPLIGTKTVSEIMCETPRRIRGWLASGKVGKMPAKRREHSVVPLWCQAAVEVFHAERADLMKDRVASKWSDHATFYVQDAAGKSQDADGNDIPWESSAEITVRWRVDGVGTKKTFRGPGHRLAAQRLIDNVARAHIEGWAKDERRWPIEPPARVAEIPAVFSASLENDVPLSSAAVPTAPRYDPERTVAFAVDILRNRVMNRRGQQKQKNDELSALEFIEHHLVYPEGHQQLEVLGIPAGLSFMMDDDNGMTNIDLEWFVTVRRSINVRDRTTYDNRIKRWEYKCGVATRKANRRGTEPVLPPRPIRPPEKDVSARTEQVCFQQVDHVTTVGMDRRWITFDPYTETVRKMVGKPELPGVVEVLDVLAPDEVLELCSAYTSFTVPMRNPKSGRMELVLGKKYALFVEIRGRLALRNEEAVAVFDIDFRDLDTSEPYLLVSGSEPTRPAEPFASDAASKRQKLKHRKKGETRHVEIPLDMVPRILAHIEEFAAENGRMFTSPFGAWLDVGNWREKFWRPVLAQVMAPLPIPEGLGRGERRKMVEANVRRARLAGIDFYELRHAGITARLYDGESVHDVALWAGNSMAVIEDRYAGFIPKSKLAKPQPVPPPAALTGNVCNLTADEIQAQVASLLAELSRRVAAA